MLTEVQQNRHRKHYPVCHHCSQPIKDKTLIVNYAEVKQVFHDRFECFQYRTKSKLHQKFEKELKQIAVQFKQLYKLNQSTWYEVRQR